MMGIPREDRLITYMSALGIAEAAEKKLRDTIATRRTACARESHLRGIKPIIDPLYSSIFKEKRRGVVYRGGGRKESKKSIANLSLCSRTSSLANANRSRLKSRTRLYHLSIEKD